MIGGICLSFSHWVARVWGSWGLVAEVAEQGRITEAEHSRKQSIPTTSAVLLVHPEAGRTLPSLPFRKGLKMALDPADIWQSLLRPATADREARGRGEFHRGRRGKGWWGWMGLAFV